MILFIYTFSINRARTSGMFYEELSRQCDGKSLHMLDVSTSELPEIGREISRASLLVFDNSLILSMGKKEMLARNFYTSEEKPKAFFREVWEQVSRTDKPVFLMHPSSDLHAVNFGLDRDLYLDILKRSSGIFWPYYRFPLDTEQDRYPYTTLSRFNLVKEDVVSIWNEINSFIPISIDFPHCLGQSELEKRDRRKSWDMIIPGVTYRTREIAEDSCRQAGLGLTPYVRLSRWLVYAPYLVYSKITPRSFSTPLYQRASFRVYRKLIARSSVSFTCGSELKFFVRKFLEVPAFRTAMLAYPSNNFGDYGFEDGTHYLHCFPEEAGEKAKYLIANQQFSEKLVSNATELITREHMAANRVSQVIGSLRAFLQGKLKKAGYHNGRFEIISSFTLLFISLTSRVGNSSEWSTLCQIV